MVLNSGPSGQWVLHTRDLVVVFYTTQLFRCPIILVPESQLIETLLCNVPALLPSSEQPPSVDMDILVSYDSEYFTCVVWQTATDINHTSRIHYQ